MQILFSPAARSDLRSIHAYISEELCNEQAANKLINAILDDCGLLKAHPLLGADLSNKLLVKTSLRYLVSNKYMIMYKPTQDTIQIVRILDTRTDYLRILAKY